MIKLISLALLSLIVLSLGIAASAAAQESDSEEDYGDESALDEMGWGEPSPTSKPEDSDREESPAKSADDAAGLGEGDDDEIGWDDESDDVGFAEIEKGAEEDDSVSSKKETLEEESASSPWSVGGFLRSDLGLWVERFETNGFAKARQSLDLSARYKIKNFRAIASVHGEYDFAYLYKRDTYDAATLDVYEYLIDVRDTYLVGTIEDFDITVGKQIVVWGQGDMMSLVDVVCPRDLREPGITDMTTCASLFFPRDSAYL